MDHIQIINQTYPNTIPNIGAYISEGVDGKVYEYGQDKVIKISSLDQYPDEYDGSSYAREIAIRYLMGNNPSHFVHLYEYKFIGFISHSSFVTGAKIFRYFIMEKLSPITEDECKVFHSTISHQDNNLTKHYSDQKLKEILNGLAFGLDFDSNKCFRFIKQIYNCKLQQDDLHPRNVMKNSKGNFKLIDLDRLYLKE